ncbi:hypothetical protein DPMN_075728 [Dreissena polymorpha]|uniref:Uncharacterized protein n=1 Tax=Dreissena polymorpha TaxID=45954 RepID=A0A9D3YL19_DREPO|nr:hypothetical protein DPMN_075728 [Dreissena polymorpha]
MSTDASRPPTDHSSRKRSKLPRLWSHDVGQSTAVVVVAIFRKITTSAINIRR